MKFTLSQSFIFEAAHTLDRSDSSRRIHGHTYHCEISITGEPDENGMVVDLAQLQNVAEGVRDRLDHRFLDDVEGLGAPTLENLCQYIAGHVGRYPCFTSVKVWRADGGACTLTVTDPGQ